MLLVCFVSVLVYQLLVVVFSLFLYLILSALFFSCSQMRSEIDGVYFIFGSLKIGILCSNEFLFWVLRENELILYFLSSFVLIVLFVIVSFLDFSQNQILRLWDFFWAIFQFLEFRILLLFCLKFGSLSLNLPPLSCYKILIFFPGSFPAFFAISK